MRKGTLAAGALILLFCGHLVADAWNAGPMVPAAEPFSLSSYDAIQAVSMIRRVPALLELEPGGRRVLVPVRSVHSVWIDFLPEAFENHQNRYDVILNGEPLEWDTMYIEYAGEMINLRLLFTYRNQKPIPPGRYRIGSP